MRAKFVKADLLYSSPPQPQVLDPNQLQGPPPPFQPTMGTVDYNAFSQPPPLPHTSINIINPEHQDESKEKEAFDFGSDFQIPAFEAANFHDDEDDTNMPFFKSFSYTDSEPTTQTSNNVKTSSTSKESLPQTSQVEVSKFGFNGVFPDNTQQEDFESESLSDNIAELELTSNTKELNQRFSQAKYQVEMGNTEKGNEILGEMMDKKEIRYKELSNIEQDIINTLGPLSD